AAAGAHRAPIILVRGTAASVDDETAELLTDLGSREFVIAGSAATVSSGIEASLAQRLPGATVSRAGGSNRYETSALLAAQAFPSPTPGRAVIATGLNYPDALVGAAYAGRLGRPLLLSPPLCATESIRQVLLGPAYTSLTLLGNSGALRGLVGTLEPCRSLSTASSLWVVVNKHRPFSSLRYVPSGLVTPSVRYPNGHRL